MTKKESNKDEGLKEKQKQKQEIMEKISEGINFQQCFVLFLISYYFFLLLISLPNISVDRNISATHNDNDDAG